MIWKAGIWKKFFTVQPRGLTFLLHRHQTGSQVVLVQCFVLSTTQRPYFFVNFWLSPDDPTYFCIFLSLNAKNHALTQWPLIFWACALTECPSLLEGGPYTRIHLIFDCPPPREQWPTVFTKPPSEKRSRDRQLNANLPHGKLFLKYCYVQSDLKLELKDTLCVNNIKCFASLFTNVHLYRIPLSFERSHEKNFPFC